MALTIKVIHVNHQLSSNAQQWALFCKQTTEELGLDYYEKTVDLNKNSKEGMEAEARNHRYQALESITQNNDIICTAHHLDDQIETFFIRLLRGSGIKGLSSIQGLRKHHDAWLARPLLALTKSDLKAYANVHSIKYIKDESNDDNHYDRNYIRNEIIPVIAKRFPSYQKTINRSVSHIQSASFWLDDIAKALLEKVTIQLDEIDLIPFYDLNQQQQSEVIRSWLEANNLQQISSKKLTNLVQQMCNSDALSIDIANVMVKKYQNHCYIVKRSMPLLNTKRIVWNVEEDQNIEIVSVKKSLNISVLNGIYKVNNKVEVGFRTESESIYIEGVGNQSLKKYFQTHRVPPWLRDSIPLIYVNDKLVKVCL